MLNALLTLVTMDSYSYFGRESINNRFFADDKEKTPLCRRTTLSADEVKQLVEAIEENYYFEFIIG